MKEVYYGRLCAEFYDATKKFASEVELNFYTDFMPKDGRVLEAMTGSGRLQIPLMQRGYIVDGVDCSPEMLQRCVQRSAQFGLVPSLYQQWLHELNLPYQYQTVVIAVGSFQLITKRDQALNALVRLRDHMSQNGNLLISLFDPSLSAEPWSKRVVKLSLNRSLQLTTRRVLNLQQQLAEAYCNYELIELGQVVQTEQELIQVTWYNRNEFIELLKMAGFKVVEFHDYPLPNQDGSQIVQAQLW